MADRPTSGRPGNGPDPGSEDPSSEGRLLWPDLTRGTLVGRRMRFLADVDLDSGERVTAHCPNTGAMTSCCLPGRPVFLSRAANPRRKLPFTWELIDMPDSLVGVNTGVPNRLAAAAAAAGRIPELAGYRDVRREVRCGTASRIDLMLSGNGKRPCYVEVKNCTLVANGEALFPDAVTDRGRRHLGELSRFAADGGRAVMFYCVQRMDARCFRPADAIDPAYGTALREAVTAGVEVVVYDTAIDLDGIRLRRRLPHRLDGQGA